MRGHGIGGSLLSFFENYLSDRLQSVFINSSISDFQTVNAGVPQGSVLGPFLFLLYVNDIADTLCNVARLFADDTSISASSTDIEEIKQTLDRDLKSLNEWSITWKVAFNPSKTEILLIGNRNESITLEFNDTLISSSSSHKHLGLTFSSNAKWSLHIDNICKSALKEINVLRKLKFTLSRKALNKIYRTFILPLLEYACEVWDGLSVNDEDKLEKIQLQAARIVTGLPLFASREALYFETGWETLKDRRNRRKLTLFHKIYHRNTPQYLHDIIQPLVRHNTYNVRNNDDFTLPNYRLQSTRISFFPSTIKLWNDLEPDIRHNGNFHQFRNYLRAERDVYKIPNYFYVGDRKYNVILTRLRNMCSNLNYDLFRVNLTNTPNCYCGMSLTTY